MEVLPRRSCASDASYIWSAEAAELAPGRVVSPGAAEAELLAPGLELSAQLAQTLLALAGELLQLHQLLLDIVQVAGQVSAQLPDRSTAGGERVHDALLHPDHLVQLCRANGIPACRFRLEQGDVVLDPLDVALGDAAGENPEHGSAEPDPQPHRTRHCGAVRLLPPAVISNSSRRFWA